YSLAKWPTSRHNRSHRQTANTLRRCHEIRCHSLSHKHVLLKGRNQANFALTTSTLFIRFSELILIAHIRWTIEINIGTSTVFEHIECSLYRVLLFVRVHPLRVTGPVIDHRRPWRHNTTTVASNRPNQTTIRVPATTIMESQSTNRVTVSAANIIQAPLRLTFSSRLHRTMNTGHLLE